MPNQRPYNFALHVSCSNSSLTIHADFQCHCPYGEFYRTSDRTDGRSVIALDLHTAYCAQAAYNPNILKKQPFEARQAGCHFMRAAFLEELWQLISINSCNNDLWVKMQINYWHEEIIRIKADNLKKAAELYPLLVEMLTSDPPVSEYLLPCFSPKANGSQLAMQRLQEHFSVFEYAIK